MAATITVDDLKARYPELLNRGDVALQSAIDEAGIYLHENWKEPWATQALLAVSAHIALYDKAMELGQPLDDVKTIKVETTTVERHIFEDIGSDRWFMATPHGRKYVHLRNTTAPTRSAFL